MFFMRRRIYLEQTHDTSQTNYSSSKLNTAIKPFSCFSAIETLHARALIGVIETLETD